MFKIHLNYLPIVLYGRIEVRKMLVNSFYFLGSKMTSPHSQDYSFQNCLMNVPFSNLNYTIYPNAETIPEYIRNFASAMFVNDSFWMNRTLVAEELQKEGILTTILTHI